MSLKDREQFNVQMLGDSLGIPDCNYKICVCDYCKQEYKFFKSYIVIKSDFNDKVFCSYNCRCKYYKENEQERAEYFYQKYYNKDFDIDSERKKRKYRELKGGKR